MQPFRLPCMSKVYSTTLSILTCTTRTPVHAPQPLLNVQLPITLSGSAPAAQVGPFIAPIAPSTSPNSRRMVSAGTNLHNQGGHGTTALQNAFGGRGISSAASGATVPARGRGRGRGRGGGPARTGLPATSSVRSLLLCLVPVIGKIKFVNGLESNNLIAELERVGLTTELDIVSGTEELWETIDSRLASMLNHLPEQPRFRAATSPNAPANGYLQLAWQPIGPRVATLGSSRLWSRLNLAAYEFTFTRLQSARPKALLDHPTRDIKVLLLGQSHSQLPGVHL